MMQIDLRRTAAVLVGAAMVAGIAYLLVSDSDARPPAPPPPAANNGPTPTPSPTPTIEPPPELANHGNDFDAIWRSIIEFRHWMYSNDPSGDLLARVYERTCKCYERELRAIERLNSRGWVYADEGVDVINVEVVERTSSNIVVLEVVDRHGPQILVDQTGSVVKEGRGWIPVRRAIVLHRGANGAWRVTVAKQLGLARDTDA